MLNFDFTQDQLDIKNAVREYCKKNITFAAMRKMDDEGKLNLGIVKDLAGMGLMAMTVSKEYGGIEADPITVGIVAEELARAEYLPERPRY